MGASEISNGELFADLQVSFTEVVLVDVLERMIVINDEHKERRSKNRDIINTIKSIMVDRFSPEEIDMFLEKGFPREVDLTKVIT